MPRSQALLDVGSKVWLKRPTPGKLNATWAGPFQITEVLSQHRLMIKDDNGVVSEFHRDHTKPHVERNPRLREGSPETNRRPKKAKRQATGSAGADEYQARAIVSERRGRDGKPEFKTLWLGYPDDEFTWEPESSFYIRGRISNTGPTRLAGEDMTPLGFCPELTSRGFPAPSPVFFIMPRYRRSKFFQ